MVTSFDTPAWGTITRRDDDRAGEILDGGAGAATAFGAVVVYDGSVRWQSAARTEAELVEHVAGYVRDWAPYHLWPKEAERVARWLDRDDPRKAVLHYFATVGKRWGAEELHVVGPGGLTGL